MTQRLSAPITTPRLKLLLLLIFTLTHIACDSKMDFLTIPEKYQPYLSQQNAPIEYKALPPGHDHQEIPDSISKPEALADIEMLEYLITTSYSGYEYWQKMEVDFGAYFTQLKAYANQTLQLSTLEFENTVSAILHQIYDGHISFVGKGYHGAYHHKAVYYTDILVERTGEDQYKVISSKNMAVPEGSVFTEENKAVYLFKTLSPPEKEHYLVGHFTFDPIRSIDLSFDHKIVPISLRRNRLLLARLDDPEPFYISWENEIPIVRVTGFGNALYPQMQDFMQAGSDLKNEDIILINLFNNGGGSSVFPQTFLKNLNGPI